MPKPPTTKTTKTKTATAKPKSTDPNGREVLYPKLRSAVCEGDKAITANDAKKLLGWSEEKDGDYLILDENKVKIRCHNNNNETYTNRPLSSSNLNVLIQEHLRGNYVFNGEPIIIGRTGLILNGQHSLISLVLACQRYELDPESYELDQAPTLPKLVVYGIDESDATVNTMDTAKPRSLSDVLYRSDVFADADSNQQRKEYARTCQYAIKTLWYRMGSADAFAPRQTHSESCRFLESHLTLLESVRHVVIENCEGSISNLIPLGYAAALHYLMSVSSSSPEKYIEEPSEASLDFSNQDNADKFFVLLQQSHKDVVALKDRLMKMYNDEEYGVTKDERIATIVKAWNAWLEKGKVELKDLKLKYEDDEGIRTLAEEPDLGGIDLIVF